MKKPRDLRFLYFSFPEKNGLICIFLVFIGYIGIEKGATYLVQPEAIDMSIYSDLFIPKQAEVKSIPKASKQQKSRNSDKLKVKPFDASKVTSEELLSFGINKKAVNNFIKYREKGGFFNKAEDLKKVYNLSDTEYEALHPFFMTNPVKSVKQREKKRDFVNENLEIGLNKDSSYQTIETSVLSAKMEYPASSFNTLDSASSEKQYTKRFSSKSRKPILIDINTADEVELQYLKGIGPSFAKRIVKYRDIVGGYHNVNQLTEVYGLDHIKLNEIRNQITLSNKVKPIDINADHPSKMRHPYISYQEAKIIVAYTKQHGPFNKPADILKIKILDAFFLEKIDPYLPKEW